MCGAAVARGRVKRGHVGAAAGDAAVRVKAAQEAAKLAADGPRAEALASRAQSPGELHVFG